jgi:chromosome partition protein MukE
MKESDMESNGFDRAPDDGDAFRTLRDNPGPARKVIHSLLNGKHIDAYLAEEFRFLESYPMAWEEFFEWLGYRLKRSELGGSPFYFLAPATELAHQLRLSRGATFLGLYMAWHFFMRGPGEPDRIAPEEIFDRLVNSYPFHLLRSIFVRRTGVGAPAAAELSGDQAEKLRTYMRKELGELARYRFIDLRPNARAPWADLVVYRLPALYRFWELALRVRAGAGNGNGHASGNGGQNACEPGLGNGEGNGNGNGSGWGDNGDDELDALIAEVWGEVDPDPDEEDQ